MDDTHLLPYEVIDNRELISSQLNQKAILFSKLVDVKRDSPTKFVKLRFMNDLNIPIKVQFLKFTAYSEENIGRYVISKMIYSEGKLSSYCLKWNENKNRLTLVDCYYCIMYTVQNCQFVYKGEDSVGIVFAYEENNIIPNVTQIDSSKIFYIKNYKKSENSNNKINPDIKKLSSFLSDELDYSSEIVKLEANSTISSDYPVKNVLYNNLDYWSSSLISDPQECKPVEIETEFSEEIVVKTITIEWVKTPKDLKLIFCDKDSNCESQTDVKKFEDFNTKIVDIYRKAVLVKLIMTPDSKKCYCSIKRLSIFKNEIDLKNVDSEEIDDINTKSDDKVHTKNLFTENFLLTKVSNNTRLLNAVDVEKLYRDYTQEKIEIGNFFDMIQSKFLDRNSLFTAKIRMMEGLKGNYTKLVGDTLQKIQNFKNDLKSALEPVKRAKLKIIDILLDSQNKFLKNETISSSFGYIHKLKRKIEKVKSFFKNYQKMKTERSIENEIAMQELHNAKIELNTFLEDTATKFSDAFADQYVTKAFENANSIKVLQNRVKKLDELSSTYDSLLDVEEGVMSLKRMSIPEMNKTLMNIQNDYRSIYDAKSKELSDYLINFKILLQSLKLINFSIKKTYVGFPDSCKKVDLITNSFMDNFVARILVKFTPQSRGKTDILIFKLLSKQVYYYIQYSDSFIEIWKRKYSVDTRLTRFDNCTNELDKFDQIEDFTKLFYLHIEVIGGELKVKLNIDYHPVPSKINEHIKWLRDSNYDFDKLNQLNNLNASKFEEQFENAKLIYEKKDIDLYLSGYFGLYSPRNNTDILLIDGNIERKTPSEKEPMMYLNSKYKYNFFQSVQPLLNSTPDNVIREFLGIDYSWNFFNTEFQILSNFYFKFELDLNFIFGGEISSKDSFNSTVIKENTEEIQNSVYFYMNSTMTENSYFFEIVKVDKGFIFKLVYMNKFTKKRVNIFRKRVDNLAGHQTKSNHIKNINFSPDKKYTFIFVKNNESLVIHIKLKSRTIFKSVFTMRNFNFVEFLFLLNAKNKAAVSSIYFSDTFGGSFISRSESISSLITDSSDPDKVKNKCSSKVFKTYKCIVKDRKVCEGLFCKSCCTKRLMKEAKKVFNKCVDICKDGLKDKRKIKISM